MSYQIVKNYVDKKKYSLKCPFAMTPKGVTVHNTWNDAPAKNEVAYMRNNNSSTSFHVAVDDKEVVIGIPLDRNAFHAGDGRNGKGNRQTIGVEICYSKSGGKKFDEAEKNAASYIATLLKEFNLGIKDVYRHKDWNGKDCPHRTIDYGWQRFLNMIKKELKETPKKKLLEVDGLWGRDCTKKSQKVYGTTVDGEVSNQPYSCKKYLPNCMAVSWEFCNITKSGSALIKAVQTDLKKKGYYTGAVDGYCGRLTVTAIQKFLKAKGFYKGKINGSMDERTVKAWQEYINSRL